MLAESRMVNWDTRVSSDGYECSHTADVAIFGFTDSGLKVLLVKRNIEPFQGDWMLPGGLMQQEQTLEKAVSTVLESLIGISDVFVSQIGTYSAVNRHPVKRVLTTGYYALVRPEQFSIEPRNYITDARWFDYQQIDHLGFDHLTILRDARKMLRKEALFNTAGFHLLPEKFTLKDLQDLYEILLGEKLDRRNFRRKINGLEMVMETKEKRKGVQGAPSLYKLNPNFKSENQSFKYN